MHPIHKEKYYLTGDTFHTFMRDRLALDLKREKNQYKVMAGLMFLATVVVFIMMFTGSNTDVKSDLVWMVMPVVLIVIGLTNLRKIKQADIGLDRKIIRDYTEHKYADYQIEVKFYEDKLVMKHREKETEMQYNTLRKYYEGEKYFAVYFTTGEIVILNPNCKKDKIKEIINGYVESLKAEN